MLKALTCLGSYCTVTLRWKSKKCFQCIFQGDKFGFSVPAVQVLKVLAEGFRLERMYNDLISHSFGAIATSVHLIIQRKQAM